MTLGDTGYAVVPGPFHGAGLAQALAAIDHAIAEAGPGDIKHASTGTNVRVNGLLGRAPVLAGLFTHQPLLRAASALIGHSFKLSGFHARTVLPGAPAQALHQDVAPHGDGWPLLAFIFIIDPFSAQNGATRFVPASAALEAMPPELALAHPDEQRACGEAGSMILFNGSVWHGFGANHSPRARRSVYGALIPASALAAVDYEATLPPAVWASLAPAARRVLTGT